MVQLGGKDLEKVIENLEARGEDTSSLKAAIKRPPATVSRYLSDKLSDEDYLSVKYNQTKIDEGPGLKCSMCAEEAPKLYSGTCEPCFRTWMLSCKKE